MFSSQIAICIKGWCSGMTEDQIFDAALLISRKYYNKNVKVVAWDGDLLCSKGNKYDEERKTNKSFTAILPILKYIFPEASFVAFKKNKSICKLDEFYLETMKSGAVEYGYPIEIFGESNIITSSLYLSKYQLNIIPVPDDISWKDIGIMNTRFWFFRGYNTHYITIGGGDIVNSELCFLKNNIHELWRLPMTRIKNNRHGEEVFEEVKEQNVIKTYNSYSSIYNLFFLLFKDYYIKNKLKEVIDTIIFYILYSITIILITFCIFIVEIES